MTSPRQWWRRAAAAVKDKRSLCLARVAGAGRGLRSPELEVAVIRATSHDERSMDCKSAGRVFTWARTSPSSLGPLMWALARRAGRTRTWAVALKALMLAHGLLLISDDARGAADRLPGRVPFDLADFRDRSSSPAKASAFSAFVRAYFHFLDHRSLFSGLSAEEEEPDDETETGETAGTRDEALLQRLERLQILLDLMMQIRPYGNGMEVGLILEAMDCVLIEVFQVYSSICKGIARFLLVFLGPNAAQSAPEERRRIGSMGMKVLRKAAEQSSQLSSYFEACKAMGVPNAAELPPVERIPDEDLRDLEGLVAVVIPGRDGSQREEEGTSRGEKKATAGGAFREVEVSGNSLKGTVVTKEWVVFEDATAGGRREVHSEEGNPFLRTPERSWPSDLSLLTWAQVAPLGTGNLIELM